MHIYAWTGNYDWFFIGTPGYGAPFHLDNVNKPSWQAQISGVKEWKLRAPPECRNSYLSNICITDELRVDLHPGDIIVVNTNWWEHATYVKEGISITVTNEY